MPCTIPGSFFNCSFFFCPQTRAKLSNLVDALPGANRASKAPRVKRARRDLKRDRRTRLREEKLGRGVHSTISVSLLTADFWSPTTKGRYLPSECASTGGKEHAEEQTGRADKASRLAQEHHSAHTGKNVWCSHTQMGGHSPERTQRSSLSRVERAPEGP